MNHLFWGLFFVALNFEVQLGTARFGLLPDFLGWYLMMKGMENLAREDRRFDRGRHWAFGLMLLSAVLYIGDLLNPDAMAAVGLWALKLAGICVGLFVIRNMIAGIRQMESDQAKDLNGQKLHSMWMIHAVMAVIAHLFSWMPLVGDFAALAGGITAICLLIVMGGAVKRYKEREL